MARFQTCPKCRALLEPGTRRCPYCEADQGAALAMSPEQDAQATNTLGMWLIGVCAVLYMLMVVLDPARGDKPTENFEPTNAALTVFGAHHPVWVRECGQWWRIVTANFVHLDVLHLLMNSVALYYVVSLAAFTLGAHRTWVLYLISGVVAVLASDLYGHAGGGASGAICGMIGALAVYGHRRGGFEGRMLKRRMLGWALFIAAFGLFWPGVDNLAHGVGFAVGAALGWFAAGARARGGRADQAWQVAAYSCTVVCLVAVGFLVPNVLRGQDRREVDVLNSSVKRAMEFARGDLETFRGRIDAGPGDSDELAVAVNRAVKLRREHAPVQDIRAALRRAEEEWLDWKRRARCRYQLGGLE